MNKGNVLTQDITVKRSGTSDLIFNQTYTYDELNRLKTATETNNSTQTWKQTFTFDRYGNRRFVEANTTMPTSFSNQALTNPTISTSNNRLTSTGWTHDSAGNTTGDPDGRSFIYDAENKQIEVKNSSNSSIGTYFFDGDGKRVKKVVPGTGEVTVFVYDAAGKLIGEYSTVVASANDAKVAYLTADHLGSPRINTDVNGQVTARHDYHPFGEEIATAQRTTALGYADDTVRKQFTGYERDTETDLDFAQARMYASSFGRFMSPDSFTNATKVSDPPSWNLYLYVTNKPMNLVDPSGKKGEISWYTDNDGVIQVNVKASFAVYGAAGQNVSKADLKIYKDALVKGIRELLTRSGEIDGKSVQLTTNISAKIYSSEESAIHSGRDNVVAIGYDAIQDDDGRKAVGITFGIAGEKFDRMAVSVAHDPNGGGLAPAGGWVEVAKNIFGHEFGSHGLGGTHNDNPGEEASLFSPDGGNGAIFQSDLKQIVFGYNDQTFIDAPPARGQKYVPVAPSYNLSATGNSSRRANAIYRNSTNPADVYHWVSSVKH